MSFSHFTRWKKQISQLRVFSRKTRLSEDGQHHARCKPRDDMITQPGGGGREGEETGEREREREFMGGRIGW